MIKNIVTNTFRMNYFDIMPQNFSHIACRSIVFQG